MESMSNGSVEVAIEAEETAGGRKRQGEFGDSSEDPTPSNRCKTRRLSETREEDSISPASLGNLSCDASLCSSRDLDSCSSKRLRGDAAEFVDLEDTGGDVAAADSAADIDNRREVAEASSDSDTANDSIPRLRDKFPTDDELNEFFTAAEKDLQLQFINKYNFDVIKDQPLEGRYEWFQIQSNP